LVEECALDLGLFRSKVREERIIIEIRIKGVTGDVGDYLGNATIRTVIHQRCDMYPSEGALINEPQLAILIIEAKTHAHMWRSGHLCGVETKLPAHSQMSNHCQVCVIKWEPQVLSASTDVANSRTDKVHLGGLTGPSNHPGMENINGADAESWNVRGESTANDFNLWKFRHCLPTPQ
jgi:hypothetical protein